MISPQQAPSETAELKETLITLRSHLVVGETRLMEQIDKRDSPAWAKAFARWTALDQRYQTIVNENPGIEGASE